MKYLLLLFWSLTIYSQTSEDAIILHNDTLRCKIERIEKSKIYYNLKNTRKEISVDDVKDLIISDPSINVNKYLKKIETPSEGKSLVYIYRPHSVVNMFVNVKIIFNGNKLVKIKDNSYFIHEVEPGLIEYKGDFWLTQTDPIKINIEPNKIYFLQVDQTGSMFSGPPTASGFNNVSAPSSTSTASVDFLMFLRNKNVAEIILSNIKNKMTKIEN